MGPHGLGLARAEGVLGLLGILGMTFLLIFPLAALALRALARTRAGRGVS